MTQREVKRRSERGHRYAYVGPSPGSYWDKPDVIGRLRALSEILLELHEAAGHPAAYRIAISANVSQTTVSYLLAGRRVTSWELTRRIAAVIAHAAGRDWVPVERRLRDAYIKTYDRGDRS